MTPNISSIFESAVAEIVLQADISDFPRVRTWRSIDAEGRWSPEADHALPVIFVTASTPEPDPQGQRQVTVTVGALVNAADDLSHERITEIESGLQDALDRLEAQYCNGGRQWDDFLSRVNIGMAGASFDLHVGGFESGPAQEPSVEEGMLMVSMQIIIHYSRSDR